MVSVRRPPGVEPTALEEIDELAGEYWQPGDGTAQYAYDCVAREVAQAVRAAGYEDAAVFIERSHPVTKAEQPPRTVGGRKNSGA